MRHPDHIREAVVRDYEAGAAVNYLSERYGVSPESVRLWARKAGIPRSGGEYVGRCTSCGAPRAQASGFCRPCAHDIPLTGGRWVPRGGIVVWQVAS